MIYLNIKTTDLRRPEMMGSEPVERATWLFLCAYCVEQENDGQIEQCRKWKDRQWQQTCGVTLDEVDSKSDLWAWEGDNLTIYFYPHDKQAEVQAKRVAGKKGGKKSGKVRATRSGESGGPSGHPTVSPAVSRSPSIPPAEQDKECALSSALSTASTERKGRERKGKERNSTTAASGDAGEEIFYRTKLKKKLTGRRLDTFNRFWATFAWPKGKADAADAWLNIPELTSKLVDHICNAAEMAAADRADIIAKGSTPQYAQGWINGKRWEDFDEPEPKPTPKPVLPPHNWEAAMLEYFTNIGMTGALARHKAGTHFQKWEDLPMEDRTKIREVAHAIEQKAANE